MYWRPTFLFACSTQLFFSCVSWIHITNGHHIELLIVKRYCFFEYFRVNQHCGGICWAFKNMNTSERRESQINHLILHSWVQVVYFFISVIVMAWLHYPLYLRSIFYIVQKNFLFELWLQNVGFFIQHLKRIEAPGIPL